MCVCVSAYVCMMALTQFYRLSDPYCGVLVLFFRHHLYPMMWFASLGANQVEKILLSSSFWINIFKVQRVRIALHKTVPHFIFNHFTPSYATTSLIRSGLTECERI